MILLALLAGKGACPAFSLLGPYANWMDYTNGYKWGGEIGGPMDLGHGYRWSVPIVTYAFDQSFLDSFGSNGVTAVEGGNRHSQSIAPGLQRRPYKLPSRDDQFWIAR